MGLLPPSLPGSQFPGEDWLVRRVQDLVRAVNESSNRDPFAGTSLVVTSDGLVVNGFQTVNTGPFKVNGDSAISGKLDVGGAATFYVATAFNGTVGLYGPVTVTGGLTCNSDAAFTGYTTLAGARFNGGTTFIGDASFSGYTTIAGARFTGGLTFDNAPTLPGATFSGASTFNAGTTFAAAAPATFNGSATFNGGATFASSPSFSTAVNMPNGATVGGTATFNGAANFNGGATVSSLSVGGASTFTGDATFGGIKATGYTNLNTMAANGATITGNLTVTGTKAFVMEHPLHRDTMTLMHCATESPVNGVEYWGNATTDANGTVTVTLPGYFEALTKPGGRSTQLTPAGKATVIPWASDIVNGAFTINADPGLKINWLVKAERQHLVNGADTLAFEAEQNQPLGAH